MMRRSDMSQADRKDAEQEVTNLDQPMKLADEYI